VTPPALFSAQPVEQPLPGNGLPNYSQLFNPLDVAGTPQNPHPGLIPPPVAAAPANDGFEAPLFVETPAENGANGLPAIDFSAPIVEPDTVDLGQAAPLPLAKPTEPADPFSDDALFPGTTEPATSAPAAVPNSSVAEASEPVESIPPAQEEVPVEENPYSGLTLDADPFSNPIAIQDEPTAPTAPREFPIEEPAFAEETVETDPPALMTPPDQDAPARIEEQPEQRVALSTPDANIEETPAVQDEATSLPPTRLIQTPAPGNERTRAKQEMIAARKGLRGLKGFCPVILRDDRDLADAHSQFRVIFNSKTYYLSSSEAVTAFHSDPAKYAPAARGCDVIQLAISGEELEGSLDYAVWYKGRLYMFTSAETMDTFVSSPSSHATLD
jgi:YHS domain-containing protein